MKQPTLSRQTRANWMVDAAVFVGAVLASLSGIYFLFLPSGGYQGGRNPWYNVQILFSRHTWDDLHTWAGVLMIGAAIIHVAIHLPWIRMMTRRIVNSALGRGTRFSRGAMVNLVVDGLIAVSFVITAVSGIVFLFLPEGGYQGGANAGWAVAPLLSRTAWDLIHTWGGVTMIVAALVHFWIHWRWVVNVTKRFFLSLRPRPQLKQVVLTADD
jgi:cytochrome b subunit of formate dehydrogenase